MGMVKLSGVISVDMVVMCVFGMFFFNNLSVVSVLDVLNVMNRVSNTAFNLSIAGNRRMENVCVYVFFMFICVLYCIFFVVYMNIDEVMKIYF